MSLVDGPAVESRSCLEPCTQLAELRCDVMCCSSFVRGLLLTSSSGVSWS